MARPSPQAVRELQASEELWQKQRQAAWARTQADKGRDGTKSITATTSAPSPALAPPFLATPTPSLLASCYSTNSTGIGPGAIESTITGAIPRIIPLPAERTGIASRLEGKERMKKQYARRQEEQTGLGKTLKVLKADGSARKAAIVTDERKVVARAVQQKKVVPIGYKSNHEQASFAAQAGGEISSNAPVIRTTTFTKSASAPYVSRFASSPRLTVVAKRRRLAAESAVPHPPPTSPSLLERVEAETRKWSDWRSEWSVELESDFPPRSRGFKGVGHAKSVEKSGKGVLDASQAKQPVPKPRESVSKPSSTILSALAIPAKPVTASRPPPGALQAKTVVNKSIASIPAQVAAGEVQQTATPSVVLNMAKAARPAFFASERRRKEERAEIEKAIEADPHVAPEAVSDPPSQVSAPSLPPLVSTRLPLASLANSRHALINGQRVHPWVLLDKESFPSPTCPTSFAAISAYLFALRYSEDKRATSYWQGQHVPLTRRRELQVARRRYEDRLLLDNRQKREELYLIRQIIRFNALIQKVEHLRRYAPMQLHLGQSAYVTFSLQSLENEFHQDLLHTASVTDQILNRSASTLSDLSPDKDDMVRLFSDKSFTTTYKISIKQYLRSYRLRTASRGGNEVLRRVMAQRDQEVEYKLLDLGWWLEKERQRMVLDAA
ncbi:hypothetical protein JCM11251_001544 [Rhodosporidiobolus azoricus]